MKNLKKILALVLALTTVFGCSVAASAAASDFTDYDEIDNKEAVEVMNALNVIGGYNTGDFKPDGYLTRAEMCKMVAYVMNGGKSPVLGTTAVTTYSDIKGHWAQDYIEYATSMGIVSGVGGGKFNPNGTLTGTQAAKMMLTAMGYDATVFGFVGNGWDVNINRYANEAGLYNGLSDLQPNLPITRDQAAQLMYNAIQGTMMKKGWSQDLATGVISESYNPWMDGTNDPHTMLEDKFDANIQLGYLSRYTYNSTKGVWTYDFTNPTGGQFGGAVLSGNNVIAKDSVITRNSDANYTDFQGRQVKVIYNTKDKDIIYGVYSNDSSVVVSGFSGDVTTNAPAAAANEIKIGDVRYDLKGRADSVMIYVNNAATATAYSLDEINGSSFTGTYDNYSYEMIDNTGDGKIDAVVITPFTFGKVTYVGNDTVTVSLQNGDADVNVSGNRKLADVVTYDGIAKDDYVMCINGTYSETQKPTYIKAEIASGTISGVRGSEYKIGDNWYTNVTGNTINTGDTIDYVAYGSELHYVKVTSGAFGTDAVGVVYNIQNKAASGISSAYVEAGVLKADGTEAVGKVVEVNGVELYTSTSNDDVSDSVTGPNANGTSDALTISALAGELVKYDVDSDGNLHLWTITAGYTPAAGTQFLGFDGALGSGATFDNVNDKVGGKELHDDAVVFVVKGTSAKVYTGKELKNTVGTSFGTASTTYASGLYGKVNGFSYAQVVVLTSATWPNINTGAQYGYLVKDAYTNKEDGVNYRYFSYWDGEKVVEAKEKDEKDLTGFKAGSVITFDVVEDGVIKNVALPTMGLGAVDGWDASTGRISIDTDTTSGNSKVNADTVVFYVDSKNTAGVAGGEISEAVDLNSDTTLEDNVMYLAGGNDTYALIVVDVNHKIENAPVVNHSYTNVSALETALATSNINVTGAVALNTNLTVPNGRTLTISGTVSGSSTITLQGTASLKVNGNITNSGAITVNSGSLNVSGNVAGAVASAGTVVIGGTSAAITATAGTVDVAGNTTGAVELSNAAVGKFAVVDGSVTLADNAQFTATSIDWTDTITTTGFTGIANLTGTTSITTTGAETLNGKWTIAADVTLSTSNEWTVGANSSVTFNGNLTLSNKSVLKADAATSKFSVAAGKSATTAADEDLICNNSGSALTSKNIAGASFTGTGSGNKWNADADLESWS